jgi:membrane glycosyltransferase
MDEALIDRDGRPGVTEDAAAGMPPEAPAPMPTQRLDRLDEAALHRPLRDWADRAARRRRQVVLGASAALAVLAINELRLALAVDHLTFVAVVVLVLFAVNVSWISLSFVVAVVGLFREARPDAADLPAAPLSSRTALIVPTYNEDPAPVAAAIEAMAHALVALGEGRSFDVFVLSDTTLGDVALAEEAAVAALRLRLGDAIRVHYRRRAENRAHKSGNIRDFCERWGGAYDHLLVLDADSLMDGATLVRLARRMEADPDAGLIQTLPRLHRGTTLLARVQQFAGALYGSLLGKGLAWWTGHEGNFWGHNAILRTRAFMSCAGLPTLPGAPPFGGAILSHDFVEAALIRRGGWSVVIADDLPGSYEECPTSLVDLAIRDRRWCQGNFQHARVLRARGLHWVSRLHLVTGIMSYLAAVFWLLFVLSALALGVQYEFERQQYFSHAPSLFPVWPRIDPVRAVRLFGLTLGILIGPKVLGFLSAALSPRRRRAYGGLRRLAPGFLLELLVSALIAPVLALVHCGLVADILRGRDSGWSAQRRSGDGLPWGQAFRYHRWHMLAGVALGLGAFFVSWQLLAWLAPAVIGMVLAAPLSRLTASTAVGRWLRRLGVLRTPEETRVPAVTRAAEAALPLYLEAVARAPDLATVVRDPRLLERHLALTDEPPRRPPGEVDVLEAVSEKKIRDALSLGEAVEGLTARERGRVLALPSLLAMLARLPRGPAPGERLDAGQPT